jgi:hypothetical protein
MTTYTTPTSEFGLSARSKAALIGIALIALVALIAGSFAVGRHTAAGATTTVTHTVYTPTVPGSDPLGPDCRVAGPC